jgi:glucose/arabinose dehydrogenase
MLRRLVWVVGFLLVLIVMAVVALVGLSRFDERFRVTDWRVVIHALTGLGAPQIAAADMAQGFVLPDGLGVALYAENVAKARMLRLTSAGDLLVSQPRAGQVLLLGRDANADGKPDQQRVLLQGLDRPNGIDISDGWLYVAEGASVGRVRFDVASGAISGDYKTIVSGIPEGENHWTRTLRIGADGWVYVSIGSSCNVCIEKHDWRAAMIRFKPDGSGVERYAHGLRNSVGFDFAPWSGELYATDNGRDLLGDDFPPCELNRIEKDGFYGWPYVNGFGVADPDFGTANPALAQRAIAPAHGFAAHNAPLGMSFLRSPVNVKRFGRAAVVALHGSWNRSSSDGYKLALLQWDTQGKITQRDFLTGFIAGGAVRGRPVDIAEAPDGTLYVSDDYANVVYRIAPASLIAAAPAPMSAPMPATLANPLATISEADRASAKVLAAELMRRHSCTSCHAPGSPLAAAWQTLDKRYTLAELTQFFTAPTPPMPVFPLTPDERRALAIELLSHGKVAP